MTPRITPGFAQQGGCGHVVARLVHDAECVTWRENDIYPCRCERFLRSSLRNMSSRLLRRGRHPPRNDISWNFVISRRTAFHHVHPSNRLPFGEAILSIKVCLQNARRFLGGQANEMALFRTERLLRRVAVLLFRDLGWNATLLAMTFG